MAPDDRELDDEIRGHLAISIQERIDRGEDPKAARMAALKEFGYIPAVRDSMRRVWYSRWYDAVAALAQDMRIGLRSLLRTKGLAATVVVTLALGIGANAAIFSVVRGVLLRPLVNRDEDRLVYIQQTAPGITTENLTFSVPEIDDLKSRVTTISAFGDFSTVDFTMIGLGPEPRLVKSGVVGGSFFEVMGLRPVLGRLLDARDDGPKAAGAVVLTHRFWTTAFNSNPAVLGRTLRLSGRTATVVGVLEPSVPYPVATEIIANVVTSPHHMSATMVTRRTHRMTDLFGRLAPGVTLEAARAELAAAHADIMRAHADAYPAQANVQLRVKTLREQIAGPARTVLFLLLGAAVVVFVIGCSNVANLILARSVRRERELAVRAALGAGTGALRRTLLAESLVLCSAGAALGLLLARPAVALVAGFAARFSVRALEVTVDPSVLWVGTGLAMTAAVLLAYVPRLPSSLAMGGLGLATGGVRITPGTNRRLRAFATVQIAFSFMMVAGAGTLVATLVALHTANTGYNTRQLLVFDLPSAAPETIGPSSEFLQEVARRLPELPGVEGVAVGTSAPWRDVGRWPRVQFTVESYAPAHGEEKPYARWRFAGPNFFAVLGVPMVAGREFSDGDRTGRAPVAIVTQSLAQRMSANADVLNRHISWAVPGYDKPMTARIVGVVADLDDENVVPERPMTIYMMTSSADRLFVHVSGDPRELITPVTKLIREISADQAVARAAILEDVRADVLSPQRLNTFVLAGFAGIALLIAVVGVSGVLAFSVSARTREFGVRLAVGSTPRALLAGVLRDGVRIATIGIAAGAAGGYALARVADWFFGNVQLPGALPVVGAAAVLIGAAVVASLVPAARASRVDVLQALRSQ